jgi:hypothetical protein
MGFCAPMRSARLMMPSSLCQVPCVITLITNFVIAAALFEWTGKHNLQLTETQHDPLHTKSNTVLPPSITD